jgi:hypothetical protein
MRPGGRYEDQLPEADTPLLCQDCGAEYLVTPSEARWFSVKGFELPKRCKPCREHRKQQRAQQQAWA